MVPEAGAEREEREEEEEGEGGRGYEEEQLIKIWRQEFHVLIALTEAIERERGKGYPCTQETPLDTR